MIIEVEVVEKAMTFISFLNSPAVIASAAVLVAVTIGAVPIIIASRTFNELVKQNARNHEKYQEAMKIDEDARKLEAARYEEVREIEGARWMKEEKRRDEARIEAFERLAKEDITNGARWMKEEKRRDKELAMAFIRLADPQRKEFNSVEEALK